MPARTLLLALICFIFVGATAHAEELKKPAKPESLQHYDTGKAQFKSGQFQAAADEFQVSLKLEPSPAAYFNAGQCYRTIAKVIDRETSDKRAHLELAIWHYERFKNTTTNTPEYTALANKLVAESRVALDGLPTVEPVTSAPIAAPAENPPSAAPNEMPVQPAGETARSRWNDPLALTFAGVGVVGLGAAGLLFWNASSLRDDASRTSTQSEVNDLRDRADSRSLSGTIIGMGSGLLLVVGIVKLAIWDDRSADGASTAGRRRRSQPTVSAALSPSGVLVFGHF